MKFIFFFTKYQHRNFSCNRTEKKHVPYQINFIFMFHFFKIITFGIYTEKTRIETWRKEKNSLKINLLLSKQN